MYTTPRPTPPPDPMAPPTNQQLEQPAYNLSTLAEHLGTDFDTVSQCENLAWNDVWVLQMKDDDIHSEKIESLNDQIDLLHAHIDGYEAIHDQLVALDNAITAENSRHAYFGKRMASSIAQRVRDHFHAGSYLN